MQPALEDLVDPRTTALLVIDVQNDYVHPDGALARGGQDTAACRLVVPQIERLLEAARNASVFVVHTRNWHRAATDSAAWASRISRSTGAGGRPGLAGTWGAEFYSIEPRDGEE